MRHAPIAENLWDLLTKIIDARREGMGKNIVKGIKKYVPIFQEAKENDLKEADVVTRIMKFLEDVFGYDVIEDISKEFSRELNSLLQ